jgi:hypothetical protein
LLSTNRYDELADRGITLLQAEVARVETVRLHRDVGLSDELLVAAERTQRGTLAGLVAVEGEDDLPAELLVVVQEPTQDPGVVLAEGSAAGGDRRHHAGQVRGHHVGVALDDHGLRGTRDVAAGQVDAVEHLALLVDRRLGGVEVLRVDPVVVEEPACPEPDRVVGGVADRPQQPAPEPVVVAAVALRHQAAGDQLLVLEALLPEVLEQCVPVARRETDAERLGGRLVEAAIGEELAPGHRVGGGELLDVVGGRDLVRLDQPGTEVGVTAWDRGAALGVPQLDAVLVGEPLDGVGETEALDLLQEADHVAAFAAAEAEEDISSRGDMEGRRLLVVEGAQALLGAAARVAQGDVGRDHLVDPCALAHQRDVVFPDPSCHGGESTS